MKFEQNILDYSEGDNRYTGKIITIKYFYFESQARLYVARLREQGINSFISNANTITAFPLGNGGIGLHIREIDKNQVIPIIKELDNNNINGAQDFSYRDADHEDIAYEKTIVEQENKKNPWLAICFFIISLIILRAYLRASGITFWADSF